MRLMPHQEKMVGFSFTRNYSYQFADPGVGKTPVGCVLAGSVPGSSYVSCPPFLAMNWKRELERWAPHKSVSILSKKDFWRASDADIVIVPDSYLRAETKTRASMTLPWELVNLLAERDFHFGIIDEPQRFKTFQSQRSRALYGIKSGGIAKHFDQVVLLSGTPMDNRPIELFPVVNRFAPEAIDFMTEVEFGMKYCGGKHDAYGGMDFTGASNVGVLRDRLREKFMLRTPKSVLGDMPKIREIVYMEEAGHRIMEFNRKVLSRVRIRDLVGDDPQGGDIATLRRELEIDLVPKLIPLLADRLNETGGKIAIFGWHREAIAMMSKALAPFGVVEINGDVNRNKVEADRRIQAFQNDPKIRVFNGQLGACGVGITLTATNYVGIYGPSWSPTGNTQVEDRVCRIGQTDTTYVQYFVPSRSITEYILNRHFEKSETIEEFGQ